VKRVQMIVALGLVVLAVGAGIVGTGMLFTALTDHALGALLWGGPLALGGLYWCGRALAQSQLSARRRRATRHAQASQSSP